jgi:hypothetical protein
MVEEMKYNKLPVRINISNGVKIIGLVWVVVMGGSRFNPFVFIASKRSKEITRY